MPFLSLCRQSEMPPRARVIAIVTADPEKVGPAGPSELVGQLLAINDGDLDDEPSRYVDAKEAAVPAKQEKAQVAAIRKAIHSTPREARAMWMQMRKALAGGLPPDDFDHALRPIYTAMAVSKAAAPAGSSFTLPRDSGLSFSPLPAYDGASRTCTVYLGNSGSGKSVAMGAALRSFVKLTGLPVFGISQASFKDDPAFEGIDIKQIKLQSLVDTPITDLAATFGTGGFAFVSDDTDALETKGKNGAIGRACQDLVRLLLFVGRKLRATCFISSHSLCSGASSKTYLGEMTQAVIYPAFLQSGALFYWAKTKAGLDLDVRELRGLKSRWVMVGIRAPQFLLSTHACTLLD